MARDYTPRADIAEMSDAFALQETDNHWQSGSKQPVLKSCHSRVLQSAGRGGEQLRGLLGSGGVLGNVGAVSWGSGKAGRNDCSVLIFISWLMTRLTEQDTPPWSPAN